MKTVDRCVLEATGHSPKHQSQLLHALAALKRPSVARSAALMSKWCKTLSIGDFPNPYPVNTPDNFLWGEVFSGNTPLTDIAPGREDTAAMVNPAWADDPEEYDGIEEDDPAGPDDPEDHEIEEDAPPIYPPAGGDAPPGWKGEQAAPDADIEKDPDFEPLEKAPQPIEKVIADIRTDTESEPAFERNPEDDKVISPGEKNLPVTDDLVDAEPPVVGGPTKAPPPPPIDPKASIHQGQGDVVAREVDDSGREIDGGAQNSGQPK